MLGKFKKLENHGKLIDEMHGEIYALEYVLEERDDLIWNNGTSLPILHIWLEKGCKMQYILF